MPLTEAQVLASVQAMRAELPGAAVAITIRGVTVNAIEIRGTQDAESSGMGVFPGARGHFVLTGAAPEGMADGDLISLTRGTDNPLTLRVVGIGRPYAGIVRVYYGDQFGKGRV